MTDFALTPPRPRRRARHLEDAVHVAILNFLRVALPPGSLVLHPANGGFRLPTEAKRLRGMGVMPGAADLLCFVAGRVYAIEVKSAAGRQSDEQVAFAARCEAAGVPYSVCRSVAEAAAQLAAWGLATRARVAA